MRSIKYEGKELRLITLPSLDINNGYLAYTAKAQDEEGEHYKIRWGLIPTGTRGLARYTIPLKWDEPQVEHIGNPIETTKEYPGITNAQYLRDPHTGRAAPRIEWWTARDNVDNACWDDGLEEISEFDYFHLTPFAAAEEEVKEPANPVVEKLKEELEKFRKQVGELTTEDIENLAVKMGRGAKGWAQAISVFGLNTFMADVDYLTWEGENSKY